MSLLVLLEFKLDVYINTALCTVYVCVRACTHACTRVHVHVQRGGKHIPKCVKQSDQLTHLMQAGTSPIGTLTDDGSSWR